MRMFSRLLVIGGFAVVVGGVGAAAFSGGATTSTTNADLPISGSTFIPCAAGGMGELVGLSGQLHSVFHATQDAAGGWSITSEFNPMGVTGVGQSTGTTYHGTGNTTIKSIITPGATRETSIVDNFRLISPGPAPNLDIHATIHVTVDAQSVVTAQVTNINVDCG